MIWRTPYNYSRPKGRVIPSSSLTIPDQSYTLQDLLTKFTKGIAPPVMRKCSYDDEKKFGDTVDPFNRLDVDIFEAHEIAEQVNLSQKELKTYRSKKPVDPPKPPDNQEIPKFNISPET